MAVVIPLLCHALLDPSFSTYRDKWMLPRTLTAILNCHYIIPEALTFNKDKLLLKLSARNRKELEKNQLGDVLDYNFDGNECGLYKSDTFRSIAVLGKMSREEAFYLEDPSGLKGGDERSLVGDPGDVEFGKKSTKSSTVHSCRI